MERLRWPLPRRALTRSAGLRPSAYLAVAAAVILSGCEQENQASVPDSADYDFFVLSLSWSPSYCEIEGANANRQQCGSGRRHGFVVHGLWPQRENGWPEFCNSSEPERVPNELVAQTIDIMPSAGLIGHQWRKHGSCSGLNQRDYFQTVRNAWGRVNIPDRFRELRADVTIDASTVEKEFLAANPDLPANGFATSCSGRFVSEVRVCLTKSLDFRACEEVDRRSCRISDAAMPAPLE